jgi:two-component system cell cycle response regulator
LNSKDFLNVLLVEDSHDQIKLIKEQLHEVDVNLDASHPKIKLGIATTLAEARELLTRRKFDLILLDLSLPDASELDGLKALSQDFPETPIIIVSNNWDRQLMMDAIEHGAQDYLIKMYADKDRILQAIGMAIERQKRELKIRRLLRAEE